MSPNLLSFFQIRSPSHTNDENEKENHPHYGIFSWSLEITGDK